MAKINRRKRKPVSPDDLQFFKTWDEALRFYGQLVDNAGENPSPANIKRMQVSMDYLQMQAGV